MLRWIEKNHWLLALSLVLLWSSAAVASGTVASQESRFRQTSQQLQRLQVKQTAQSRLVRKAARRLTFLKRQARRGGLISIPARIRLPRARAKAQRLSRKLAQITRQIVAKRVQLKRIRKQLVGLYAAQLQTYKRQLRGRGLSAAARRRLVAKYRRAHRRYRQLRPARSRVARVMPRLRIKIHPLDGPRELRRKSNRLKDAEDHLKRILGKLQKKLKKLKKKKKRRRSERRLERWADSVGNSDSLFQEGARNPRVTTGRRTSRSIRQRNAQRSADAAPRAGGFTSQSGSRNEQGSRSPTSPSPAPPPSNSKGVGGSPPPKSTQNPGTAAPGTSNDAANRNPTATVIRPSTGNNSTLQPGLRSRGSNQPRFTLNPRGSVAQQLRALKEYQKHLKRNLKHVRGVQKKISKRVKQLRRERRRR